MPRKSRKIESLLGSRTAISRATETDRYVGGRIRERRVMLGLSQKQMADMIGVSYQQTHKYERGINRISAGRLYEIAQVLRVPLNYFFEGLGDRPDGGALTGRQTPHGRGPGKGVRRPCPGHRSDRNAGRDRSKHVGDWPPTTVSLATGRTMESAHPT